MRMIPYIQINIPHIQMFAPEYVYIYMCVVDCWMIIPYCCLICIIWTIYSLQISCQPWEIDENRRQLTIIFSSVTNPKFKMVMISGKRLNYQRGTQVHIDPDDYLIYVPSNIGPMVWKLVVANLNIERFFDTDIRLVYHYIICNI